MVICSVLTRAFDKSECVEMGKLLKKLQNNTKVKNDSDTLPIKDKTIQKSSHGKKSLKEKIRSRIGLSKKTSPSKFEKSLKPSLKSLKKESPIKESTINTIVKCEKPNILLGNATLEGKYNIKADTIVSAFNGVLKLLDIRSTSTNELFDDEQPVFLQVTCIKIPVCPERILRIPLKHPIITDSSEVCLIVPDVRGIPIKEYDRVIDHYEQLLHSKNIKNIKTIMPFHQLKYEYGQFELKRRLVELYDVFLVDGKISGLVVHQLGKIFYNKKKVPVPIKLHVPNLKESIDKALHKTPLILHAKGDTYIVQVGHSKMKPKNIVENVFAVIEGLEKDFPGGWDNIRALYLKGAVTESIPIYFTLKSKNEVEVPLIQPKRPKRYAPVSGELSTKNNSEVMVLPTGEVFVNPITPENENLNETNDDELEDDDINEAFINSEEQSDIVQKNKGRKLMKIKDEEQQEIEDNEDSDEDQADQTYTKEELAYLLDMEDEELESDKKKDRKQKKQKTGEKRTKQKQKPNEVSENGTAKKAKMSDKKSRNQKVNKNKKNKINNRKEKTNKKDKAKLLNQTDDKVVAKKNSKKIKKVKK